MGTLSKSLAGAAIAALSLAAGCEKHEVATGTAISTVAVASAPAAAGAGAPPVQPAAGAPRGTISGLGHSAPPGALVRSGPPPGYPGAK